MRKWMLRTHFLVSMALGLFIVAICLSGSFLVLRPDIEKWTYPALFKATPGQQVSLDAVIAGAERAYPEKLVDYIDYPRLEDGLFHVWLTTKDGKGPEMKAYIDPGTGHVLGFMDGNGSKLIQFMGNIHYYLFLQGVMGEDGATLVEAIVGLSFLIVLVTGVYVWWPGIRKLASGFRITRGRSKYVYQRDLHKTLGILTAPLLIILALTGALFTLESIFSKVTGVQTREDASAALKTVQDTGMRLPMSTLLAKVKEAAPYGDPVYVSAPIDKTQAYSFVLNEGYNPSNYGNETVYVNQYTGNVLWKSKPGSGLSIYQNLKYGLHFGTWGGRFSQILYIVIGVAPLFFMITGVAIWQLKSRAKRKGRSKKQPELAIPA